MKVKMLFILLCVVCFGFSQEEQQQDLKIGLVLSGGGAKGLAHIGALKIIEDVGVRIDYIGGTSMGAIIGALYASGYNAKQLDSLFKQADFSTLIQDNIPRSAKTFYEKDETDRYAIKLPFDKFKLSIPSGLSKGQNVYNLLSKLTSHVSDIEDFSKLPIPFFCIATNIETGEPVVLEKGYLPQAIKASGALPTLFSPVIIDGDILIDGGVVNNYPIDEVKEKGMDVIIGVDVQDSLRTKENLKSALQVLAQINNFRTMNDMAQKTEKTDVYIKPNINDFTVVSFNEGEKIITAGETAAEKFKKQLFKLASQQKHLKRETITFNDMPVIKLSKINIEGNAKYTRAYILGKLKLKKNDEVTYNTFNEGINNLSATGNFESINYRFYKDGKGGYHVTFNVLENQSNTSLKLAAHYDDLYKTAGLVNITQKRILTNNDIASLDLIVGDNIRYNFNYFVDKGYYWSIGFNSSFNFFDKSVPISFLEGELPEETNTNINALSLEYGDLTNKIYVQTPFKRSFLLSLGAEHKWLRYLSETIGMDQDNIPRTIFENTNYYSAFGALKYDTLDDSFFPRDGFFFKGDFNLYLFAEGLNKNFEPFSIAKADFKYAQSISRNISFIFGTQGGFKIGNDTTQSLDFFLGGYGYRPLNNFVPFYGYEALSLRGDTYLKSDLTVDYEFLRNNHLNAFVNIANVDDDLFESGDWIERIDYSGFGVGYGLETFAGPMEIKYAYSPERKEGEWYVTAGFRF